MAFWLFLVGGLQGHFGHWGDVDGSRVWVITDNDRATKAIIVSSYLFVCSFAVTMGPVSWTYPAELVSSRSRIEILQEADLYTHSSQRRFGERQFR